jgi:hypothetical protein
MGEGILRTAIGCCFPFKKKRSVRGVDDMFTSIITTISFSLHVEFPSFAFLDTKTLPLLCENRKDEMKEMKKDTLRSTQQSLGEEEEE